MSDFRPVLVTLEGLGTGKGVCLCETASELLLAIQDAVIDRKFGAAGDRVTIQAPPPLTAEEEAALRRHRERP